MSKDIWIIMAYNMDGASMPLAFYRSHSRAIRDPRLRGDGDVAEAKAMLRVRIDLVHRTFVDGDDV